MNTFKRHLKQLCTTALPFLFFADVALSQSATLALSSASVLRGGSVALNLSLTSATAAPAGLQWTLNYSPNDITAISATSGAASTAAGKSISCAGNSGSYTCLATGVNSTTIGNGVVAVVNVTTSLTAAPSTSITLPGTLGVTLNADALTVNGTGGTITISGGSDTAAPSVPTGLTATAASSSVVNLAWSASTDNVAVTGYRVYRNSTQVGTAVTTSYADSSLSPATTYSYTVAAYDAAGNLSARSTAASATTRAPTPAVYSLSCSPSSLIPNAITTCVVTLSGSAPAGGSTVALSRDNAALTVPTSVTVPAGATSASFSATANSVASSTSVVVTASSGGASQTATVKVDPLAQLSSLSCTPTSVTAPGTSACTVSLVQVAPTGGASVALSSNNSSVTVSPTVSIAAGQVSAGFTATVAAIAADASAQLTATTNGSSKTAILTLIAPAKLSSVACSPSTVTSGVSTSCTVGLTKAASGTGYPVTLSTNNVSLTVPASVTVPAGATSASFSATAGSVATSQAVTITASGSPSVTTTVTVQPAAPQLSALSCVPTTITGAGSTLCTVSLTSAAPSGGVIIPLTDTSTSLAVPASATVPSGATSGTFSANASSVNSQTTSQVSATYNGVTKSVTITLQPAVQTVSSLACTPTSIAARQSTRCTVALTAAVAADTSVTVSSSSTYLSVPGTVVVRAGQSVVSFTATAARRVKQTAVTVTATLGATSARATVNVVPSVGSLSLDVPPLQMSVDGTTVRFQVSGSDLADLPIKLSASKLPAGALFESAQGEFSWEPRGAEPGSYPLSFTATNRTGESVDGTVVVEVMSGDPLLKRLVQSATRSADRACSPGSLATLQGSGLRKGASEEDVRVSINGEFVPVVEASAKEITFQCPDLAAGTALSIRAYRGQISSNFLDTVMAEAAPGVFSLDKSGSGQGMVLLDGTRQLVMFRAPTPASQPAVRQDRISILATGLGAAGLTDHLQVAIGETTTSVESVTAVAPGLWQVVARVPDQAAIGESVPLRLLLNLPDGGHLESNVVTIAIEAAGDVVEP